MGDEFQESDVFWTEHHRRDDRRTVDDDVGNYNCGETTIQTQHNWRLSRKKSKQMTNSLPVSIPGNMAGRTSWFHCPDSDGDDDYDDGEMVPPHLMVSQRFAGKMAFSVCTGNGRTLKGRDLSQNFGKYNTWLAAENGMFLRLTKREWMTTMPEQLNMDWVDSVKHVFEYFTERTPRCHFDFRETSIVRNYKYADVEFGRLQTRDLLQHLWTGRISNAAVNVVQGSRSVGVTKGAVIDRILGEIIHSKNMETPIDYVLCIGHFLGKDEDIYTFFEPELPAEPSGTARAKVADAVKTFVEKRPAKLLASKTGSKASHNRAQRTSATPEKKNNSSGGNALRTSLESISWHEGSVLDLKGENYFSCTVGQKRSNARYLLSSSEEVVKFLKELSTASSWTLCPRFP